MTRKQRAPIIGLTGGIGSGKSTVAEILEDLGVRRIDTDRVGHEIYEPGTEGFRQVVEAFGDDVVAGDGRIDRARLGEKVFGDPEALVRLNAIVHPLIGLEVTERIRRFTAEDPDTPIVIEVPLLVDTGWQGIADEVWTVSTPADLALERTASARAVSRAELERRMARQASDEERRRVADVVITNEGSLDDLRERVIALFRRRFD